MRRFLEVSLQHPDRRHADALVGIDENDDDRHLMRAAETRMPPTSVLMN